VPAAHAQLVAHIVTVCVSLRPLRIADRFTPHLVDEAENNFGCEQELDEGEAGDAEGETNHNTQQRGERSPQPDVKVVDPLLVVIGVRLLPDGKAARHQEPRHHHDHGNTVRHAVVEWQRHADEQRTHKHRDRTQQCQDRNEQNDKYFDHRPKSLGLAHHLGVRVDDRWWHHHKRNQQAHHGK